MRLCITMCTLPCHEYKSGTLWFSDIPLWCVQSMPVDLFGLQCGLKERKQTLERDSWYCTSYAQILSAQNDDSQVLESTPMCFSMCEDDTQPNKLFVLTATLWCWSHFFTNWCNHNLMWAGAVEHVFNSKQPASMRQRESKRTVCDQLHTV